MILLILEAHRTLHLGRRVDELPQRIARQRVIIPPLIHILEAASLVIRTLGVHPLKQEPFNLVRRIQRITLLVEQLLRELLQNAANIRAIRSTVLIDHLAEHHHLARAKNIRRHPVKRGPINPQPQIALPLSRKSANRATVEGQVVVALHQELLVVIQHVQTAFKIAEQHRHRLDPPLVGQILQPLLANHIGRNPLPPLLLSSQVQVLEFTVGKLQKITKFAQRLTPSAMKYTSTATTGINFQVKWKRANRTLICPPLQLKRNRNPRWTKEVSPAFSRFPWPFAPTIPTTACNANLNRKKTLQ